jgi:predicted nucleic-acid-binding Zn-ribbon protein
MKRTNQCPKCGSNDIIADAKAIDRGHYNGESELSVATFRRPEAMLFKGQLTTTISAWVCADCGFVELYADSPRNIRVGAGAPG